MNFRIFKLDRVTRTFSIDTVDLNTNSVQELDQLIQVCNFLSIIERFSVVLRHTEVRQDLSKVIMESLVKCLLT
jgi:hypothetical protein